MQSSITKVGARVLGSAVVGAILLGSAGMASAYGSDKTVIVNNGAVVTNVSTATANTGFNAAGGGKGGNGGDCGFFCSGGNGGNGAAGTVTTGKAKAKTWTSNVVNTTSIKVK